MRFAESLLGRTMRNGVFERMAKRAGIDHRYSFLEPARIADRPSVDAEGFYIGASFRRQRNACAISRTHAPDLAADAIEKLELGAERDRVTHLSSPAAPVFRRPVSTLKSSSAVACRMDRAHDRRLHGMLRGDQCAEARAPHRALRTEGARPVVNLELCTVHLQETDGSGEILSFLLLGRRLRGEPGHRRAEGVAPGQLRGARAGNRAT